MCDLNHSVGLLTTVMLGSTVAAFSQCPDVGASPGRGHVVVLEDHSTIGGLADTLRRIAAPNLQVSSLGWPGHWHGEAGPINALRSAHGLDTAAIIRRIEELL